MFGLGYQLIPSVVTAWSPPRTLSAGLDWQGRGPDVILQTLGANLKRRGGTLMRGTRARRLRMEQGRCIGLIAEQNGQSVEVEATVLLADGGFQGNPDLVRRFISPRPDALTQRNAGSGAGDALIMAEEAGARLTDRRGGSTAVARERQQGPRHAQ